MSERNENESNEVTHAPKGELAVFDPTANFDAEANFEGTQPRLPKISIIHQGQMFKVGAEEKRVATIIGVILDSNRVNAYWSTNFSDSGGGDPPDCSSRNAIKPDDGEAIQGNSCITCKMNKFGSDGKKGKACKNMRRIHILMPDKIMPLRLTITSSSLANFDDYMLALSEEGLNYWFTETEMSLVESFNKEGIAFSKVVFKKLDSITDSATASDIMKKRAQAAEQMRGESVIDEDYVDKDENVGGDATPDPY